MPTETPAQRASQTLLERTTPEWRKERAQKAYLTGAVNAIVNRAPQLTPEQVAKLRAVLGGAE